MIHTQLFVANRLKSVERKQKSRNMRYPTQKQRRAFRDIINIYGHDRAVSIALDGRCKVKAFCSLKWWRLLPRHFELSYLVNIWRQVAQMVIMRSVLILWQHTQNNHRERIRRRHGTKARRRLQQCFRKVSCALAQWRLQRINEQSYELSHRFSVWIRVSQLIFKSSVLILWRESSIKKWTTALQCDCHSKLKRCFALWLLMHEGIFVSVQAHIRHGLCIQYVFRKLHRESGARYVICSACWTMFAFCYIVQRTSPN